LVLAALGAVACSKEHDSLIVVGLTAPQPVSGLQSVAISAGGATQTYDVHALDSTTPTQVGIYVPSGVTGTVMVTASVDAGGCVGYSGQQPATISAAGDTTTVDIALTSVLGCACTEYDHNDPSDTCDLTASPAVGDTYNMAAVFSPDGQFLVTAGSDQRVKIWRFDGSTITPEGHVIAVDPGATGLQAPGAKVAFSPDSKMMAIAQWGQPGDPVLLYDVATWTELRELTGPPDYVIDVGFTPDGQHVVALDATGTGSGAVYTLSANTGKSDFSQTLSFDPILVTVSPIAGSAGIPVAVSSSDGRAAMMTVTSNGFTTPQIFTVTSDGSFAYAINFSPAGTQLAAGGDDAMFHLWTVPLPTSGLPDGAPFVVGNMNGVTMLAYAPNAPYIASAAGNLGRDVSVWDLASRTRLGSFSPSYLPTAISYAPSGNAIAGGEIHCGKIFLCAR
jgi:WD40 repeat protein